MRRSIKIIGRLFIPLQSIFYGLFGLLSSLSSGILVVEPFVLSVISIYLFYK